MPIKDKTLYPANWPEIRQRILKRDAHRCKICDVQNGKYVFRGILNGIECYQTGTGNIYRTDNGTLITDNINADIQPSSGNPNQQAIKIVLTVAHLDHDPTNNKDENLAALCQLHHLRHDTTQHRTNAAETRRQKKKLQKLF